MVTTTTKTHCYLYCDLCLAIWAIHKTVHYWTTIVSIDCFKHTHTHTPSEKTWIQFSLEVNSSSPTYINIVVVTPSTNGIQRIKPNRTSKHTRKKNRFLNFVSVKATFVAFFIHRIHFFLYKNWKSGTEFGICFFLWIAKSYMVKFFFRRRISFVRLNKPNCAIFNSCTFHSKSRQYVH